MDLAIFGVLIGFCVLGTQGQVPQILNTVGSATLSELQGTDLCVYQLDVNPEAYACSQNGSSFPMFDLQKRTGDTDFCVYFLPSLGSLTGSTYTVFFSCVDANGDGDHKFVKIDIIPNEPPVFVDAPSKLEVVDASAFSAGQVLFQVQATDQNNDVLTYSMDTSFTQFDIDPTNGDIIGKVDFDTISSPTTFNFKVLVKDPHTPNEEIDVQIDLININTPPVVTNVPSPSLSVQENLAPPTSFYTCTHDENPATVTITLDVDPPAERPTFDLSPTTCAISVAAGQTLDFERLDTMTLTLNLDDGVYRRSFPFTLNVQDGNDPPTFASNSYTMDVLEGPLPVTPAVQPVFVVNDQDTSDTHTFTLGAGTYDSYFTIVPASGNLQLIKELDFDAGVTQVTVTVIATDNGGETASTTLTVNVGDVNDNDPEFSVANTELYISPKLPIGSIGQVTATDKDSGTNADLTYSLVSDSSGGKFLVQPDGTVYLNAAVTEAERNTIYNVVMRATDQGAPARSGDTTVTILFNKPPFIDNLPDTIPISEEKANKEYIFKVDVLDNDTFSCQVSRVNPNTANPVFDIEKRPGTQEWWVFYTGQHALSYSTISSFTVDVVCTDSHDGQSPTSTLTVSIRQNTPPSITCFPAGANVDASTTLVPETVYTVTATDDDTLTVTMDVQPNTGAFVIIPATGEIQTAKNLLRETSTLFTAVVTAADSFNTVSCTVTLTLTNTNQSPKFTGIPFPAEVDEDIAPGQVITTVTIDDAQECSPTSFTWDTDPIGTRDTFNAVLDPATKEVSISVAPTKFLDKETTESYTFELQANDGCLQSPQYALYLNVKNVNEPPKFLAGSVYAVNINEVNTGTVNIGCNGWDPDVGDAHTLTLEGVNSEKFAISNPSLCSLTQLQEIDLDQGTATSVSFPLTMKMIDRDGLSAEATVTVIVNEVNDHAPLCATPSVTLADIGNGMALGTALGQVTATDLDLTNNGQVSYSLTSPSSGSNVVELLGDGSFRLKADPETQGLVSGTVLKFTVRASDGGNPSRSVDCEASTQYIYTPPPTTQPPVTQPPNTNTNPGQGQTTGNPGGGGGNTLSPAQQSLQNPVILGLIAALSALALLAAVIGLACCCKRYGACKGSSGGRGVNGRSYDFTKDNYIPSRGGSRGARVSPKTGEVSTRHGDPSSANSIRTVSEVKPGPMRDINEPTALRYL